MSRYTPDSPAPQSIAFKGVENHLMKLETENELNGLTAKQVLNIIDQPKEKRVNVTGLSKLIGKTRPTIKSWLDVRERELKNNS